MAAAIACSCRLCAGGEGSERSQLSQKSRKPVMIRGSSFVVKIISAVAVRASDLGRPAGHPVPAFVAAADQASDRLGRPGFAGRLGLDYSCVVAFLGVIESTHSSTAG